MNREDVYTVFDSEGLLSRSIEGFEYRENQLNMALDVCDVFSSPSIGALEAGTGIGKSFAYLVPSLDAAFKDPSDRTVVATSTINLQKQIIEKDIPSLFEAFGKTCSVSLAVGRNNYLCLRRLNELTIEYSLMSADAESPVSQMNSFANGTETGLRTDYPGKLDYSLWNYVCSDSDFCMANHCPFFTQCFYFKAKKKLSEASIIVCNHHLLFTDSRSRLEECMDYSDDCILPPFNRLVIDEAHNIERHATDLFTVEFSSYLLEKQLGHIIGRKFAGKTAVNLLGDLKYLCNNEELYLKTADYFSTVSSAALTFNTVSLAFLTYNNISHALVTKENAKQVLSQLLQASESLCESMRHLTELLTRFIVSLKNDEDSKTKTDELKIHIGRISALYDVLKTFMNYTQWNEDVHFLEVEKHAGVNYAVLKTAPLEVSTVLKDALFSKIDSVLCTSATLDLNDDFTFWSRGVGLPVSRKPFIKKVYSSPFDYKNRLMLLTPYDAPDFSKEKENEYAQYICSSVYDSISSSGGGALVLFTNVKLMEYVFETLSPGFEVLNIKCLKQGDADRYSLLEQFKSDTDSVLFATDSFWEGVDAPGDTLRMVIITKLPFRMPDDPIYRSRYRKLEESGQSGFFSLALPEATMKLKQGFGRLMRHTHDKGIVLILDSRICSKQYGSLMLSALPLSFHPESSVSTLPDVIERFLF